MGQLFSHCHHLDVRGVGSHLVSHGLVISSQSEVGLVSQVALLSVLQDIGCGSE
jgi:hypothetical protein